MELDQDACYRALTARDPRFDGRFFVAVKTTGIYCRPICPARTPERKNVLFFATAAAAQASGFRPCLRCRPEIAPHMAAWRGTGNTVARALDLIEAGALDEANVEQLAERLGVGARQLRRLFLRHIGASPIAVAQTRRILLAKQLIHETLLPMTEVALASGFGSVRRFNETFQAMFGRPPGELRRRGGAEQRGSGGAVEVRLAFRPPYDWPAMLDDLAARAVPGVEAVSPLSYMRTVGAGDAAGTVSVEAAGAGALKAVIRMPRLGALASVIAQLRRLLDLAADPDAVAGHLVRDKLLAERIGARPGLRVAGIWDPFEEAARTLIAERRSEGDAKDLAARLVGGCGGTLAAGAEAGDGPTRLFPQPEQIAGADLNLFGLPKALARTLGALAAAVVDRPNVLDAKSGVADLTDALGMLPGVAPETARFLAERIWYEPDAFPAADPALPGAMRLAPGARSAETAIARAESWRPWRAYAAHHLLTDPRLGRHTSAPEKTLPKVRSKLARSEAA